MDSFFHNYGQALVGVIVGSVGVCGLGVVMKEKKWLPFLKEARMTVEPIKLTKKLCHKDQILLNLLCSQDHAKEAWVVTNPDEHDNPIIYASCGFCEITGYKSSEIVGRNCRFLQGEKTDKVAVAKIHSATEKSTETAVCVINYTKDGTPFFNQLYIAPLHTPDGAVAYFLGVTNKVDKGGEGQEAANKK